MQPFPLKAHDNLSANIVLMATAHNPTGGFSSEFVEGDLSSLLLAGISLARRPCANVRLRSVIQAQARSGESGSRCTLGLPARIRVTWVRAAIRHVRQADQRGGQVGLLPERSYQGFVTGWTGTCGRTPAASV